LDEEREGRDVSSPSVSSGFKKKELQGTEERKMGGGKKGGRARMK
jgi:hypothetical protein